MPGAYTGLGRGNAFLNELWDADALIHVVDASGTTNEKGEAKAEGNEEGAERGVASSPVGDVTWVRREMHMWIYTNVKEKWGTVVRRGGERLGALFSGYQASRYTLTPKPHKSLAPNLKTLDPESQARACRKQIMM